MAKSFVGSLGDVSHGDFAAIYQSRGRLPWVEFVLPTGAGKYSIGIVDLRPDRNLLDQARAYRAEGWPPRKVSVTVIPDLTSADIQRRYRSTRTRRSR